MKTIEKGSSPKLNNSERAEYCLPTNSPKPGDRYGLDKRDAFAERIMLHMLIPHEDYNKDALAINCLEIANVFAQWANKP